MNSYYKMTKKKEDHLTILTQKIRILDLRNDVSFLKNILLALQTTRSKLSGMKETALYGEMMSKSHDGDRLRRSNRGVECDFALLD